MQTPKPNFKSKAFIPLVIFSIISFSYALKKKNETTNLTTQLKKIITEREHTKKKLVQITGDYENATHKNKKLSRRVISEINKIITLKDSVNELDIDLKADKQALTQKKHLVQNLANENIALSEEINEAKALRVDRIAIMSMRKKLNGKFTRTTNIKKTDAFKVSFQIQENKLASNGEKKIHIQVLNPYNKIIGTKETIQINNTTITYSDQVIVNYNKEALNIVSFIETERKNLETGEYSVNTYINGNFVSSNSFTIN